MAEKIETLVSMTAQAWSGVATPNAAGVELAATMAGVIAGFEKLRGTLAFEDEPSFEAALQATKEVQP